MMSALTKLFQSVRRVVAVCLLAGVGISLVSYPSGAESPSGQAALSLRSALKSVHGFQREDLDATGGDVPTLLQAIIDAPGESLFVQRQAIKALALYPSRSTLGFVEQRVQTAQPGLQRLYLVTLSAFRDVDAGSVERILARGLSSPDPTVRSAAVSAGRALSGEPTFRKSTERRAPLEADPATREEILKVLKSRPSNTD